MRPMFLPSRLQDRLLRLLPQDLQTGHFRSASSAFAGTPPRLEGQSANRVHVYHRTTEILSGGAGEQGLRPPSGSARRESITPNLHPSEVGSQIRTDHEPLRTGPLVAQRALSTSISLGPCKGDTLSKRAYTC